MGGATARRDCLRVAAVGAACCLLVVHCWHIQPVVADGGPEEEAAEEFWRQFVEPTYPGSVSKFSPIQKAAFAEFAKAERNRNLFKQAGIASGVGGGLLGLLSPLLYTRSVSKSLGVPPESKVPGSEAPLPEAVNGSKGPGFFKRVSRRVKNAATPSAKGLAVGTGVLASAMLLGSLGLLVASRMSANKIREQRRRYRAVVAKQQQWLDKDRQAPSEAAAVASEIGAAPLVDLASVLAAGMEQQQKDEPTAAGEPKAAGESTVVEPTVREPTVGEPTVGEPTVGEPTVEELTAAEPPAAEPTAAEPTAAEPTVEELARLPEVAEIAKVLAAAAKLQAYTKQ